MFAALLPQRGFISITGEDARSFLQGIISNDVALAILNCLKMEETIGKTYELGGPHTYNYRNCPQAACMRQSARQRALVRLAACSKNKESEVMDAEP